MAAKMMEDGNNSQQNQQQIDGDGGVGLISGIGGTEIGHIGGMGKPRGINIPHLKGISVENLQKLTNNMAKTQCDALKTTGHNAAMSASTVAMQAMHMGSGVTVKK